MVHNLSSVKYYCFTKIKINYLSSTSSNESQITIKYKWWIALTTMHVYQLKTTFFLYSFGSYFSWLLVSTSNNLFQFSCQTQISLQNFPFPPLTLKAGSIVALPLLLPKNSSTEILVTNFPTNSTASKVCWPRTFPH